MGPLPNTIRDTGGSRDSVLTFRWFPTSAAQKKINRTIYDSGFPPYFHLQLQKIVVGQCHHRSLEYIATHQNWISEYRTVYNIWTKQNWACDERNDHLKRFQAYQSLNCRTLPTS